MDSGSRLTRLDIATWAGFIILATSSVIIGVSLPEISRTFSTGLSQGGSLETVRNLVLVVVLLLAGMLAQRWGKKRFLVLGQYLFATGFLLASFSQNYLMLILGLMVLGVGAGFSEALLNPLIVDVHQQESGRYLNLSHAFFPIGIMTSALIFGELLSQGYSWRLLFQIAAVAALTIAVLFTLLKFPSTENTSESYPKIFANILSLGGFWLFAIAIFLGAGIESALTFWSRSYVEIYLSDVPRSGAIAVMIFAGAMAIGRLLTAYLANKVSLNNIMIGSASLGVVVGILIPFATTLAWFYLGLGLAGLATASFWPSILAEAEKDLKANTTILFVLLASAGILGFGVTPWLLGFIGDSTGLRSGFAIIPLLFVGLLFVLWIERRINKEASSAPDQLDSKNPVVS